MARPRKYFVLSEPLPASQISRLLARVVEDKSHPSYAYAPTATNPADLVPDLLPTPVQWSTCREFYSHTNQWSLAGGLSELLSLEQSRSVEKGVELESDRVKSYSLSNTLQHFQKLMAMDEYAKDVQALLQRAKSGHAYFVTGFLTTASGTLKSFESRGTGSSVGFTAPLGATGGLPLPFGNPEIQPGHSRESRRERSMTITEEVIFAVSYDVIRTSKSLDWDRKGWMKRTVFNAGPKRVKDKHMAFGEDSDSEEDEDSDPEVDIFRTSRGKAKHQEEPVSEGDLVFIDTEQGWDEDESLSKNGAKANSVSFQLQLDVN